MGTLALRDLRAWCRSGSSIFLEMHYAWTKADFPTMSSGAIDQNCRWPPNMRARRGQANPEGPDSQNPGQVHNGTRISWTSWYCWAWRWRWSQAWTRCRCLCWTTIDKTANPRSRTHTADSIPHGMPSLKSVRSPALSASMPWSWSVLTWVRRMSISYELTSGRGSSPSRSFWRVVETFEEAVGGRNQARGVWNGVSNN